MINSRSYSHSIDSQESRWHSSEASRVDILAQFKHIEWAKHGRQTGISQCNHNAFRLIFVIHGPTIVSYNGVKRLGGGGSFQIPKLAVSASKAQHRSKTKRGNNLNEAKVSKWNNINANLSLLFMLHELNMLAELNQTLASSDSRNLCAKPYHHFGKTQDDNAVQCHSSINVCRRLLCWTNNIRHWAHIYKDGASSAITSSQISWFHTTICNEYNLSNTITIEGDTAKCRIGLQWKQTSPRKF